MKMRLILEKVDLTEVKKQLRKVPEHIKVKLLSWAKAVERDGIKEVRKKKGYHDEPLQGKRKGQRSIRLSLSYRAIYREENDKVINLVIVEEVNKHDY
jgi:proteic killer suppression protein